MIESEALGLVACIGGGDLSELWVWCRAQVTTTGRWPVIVGAELWMELGGYDETDPEDLIEEAADIDAAALLRSRAAMFAGVDDIGELSFADEALDQQSASAASVRLGRDAETGISLFPADAGWRVAALLGLQDSGQYEPAEHVAILRHFEERYRAGLAETNGAVTSLVLDAPVDEPDLARIAAIERIGYADTTSGIAEYEQEEVLEATKVDTVWGFWWD